MGDKYRKNSTKEEAPHSRLFILGSKDVNEDDVRDAFKEFGYIKEVWVVRDKNTGDSKGVFYVQYSKTSEAARALENMKGKFLVNKTIKVMIASSREQGSIKGDFNEEENLKRLFIVVSKSTTDNELYDYFKQFGNIEYVSVVKDKESQQNKGFAYVKFVKFSDAAVAFEECDKKYKAVFAQPRKPRQELRHHQSESKDERFPAFREDGVYRLSVTAISIVSQDQIWKLFDIVPSLTDCHPISFERNRTKFEIVYSNYNWSIYAEEKFNGFEYPPGNRLIVKAENSYQRIPSFGGTTKRSASPIFSTDVSSEIKHLAETIAQASSLIKKAGLNPDLLQSNDDENLCDRPLPARQPLAAIDSKVEARCFVICSPTPLRSTVLQDIFSRFGNLIEVYMLNKKTCGYAKYASKESAERAIQSLHGAVVMGIRLKVLEAEERPDKRQRMNNGEDIL